MKKKSIITLAVIAILLVSGVSYLFFNKQQKLETTKIRIADLPVIHGLPLYVAIEKGYFREAGIEVERIKFEAPNQLVDALMSGQVDFTSPSGATGITGIASSKNPGKIKIYALSGGDDSAPSEALLVGNSSEIKSFNDLKGKKLGILPGIQWRTFARYFLEKNGLSEKDVTLVELAVGLQAQALGVNQIDALLAIEPMPTIVKTQNLGKEIISGPTLTTIANPFYGGAGAVNMEFAKKNPNTTKKVLEVFNRAIKEINKNKNDSRQYLKGYTPMTDEVIARVPIIRFQMANNLTEQEVNAVQDIFNIFIQYDLMSKDSLFINLKY